MWMQRNSTPRRARVQGANCSLRELRWAHHLPVAEVLRLIHARLPPDCLARQQHRLGADGYNSMPTA